MSGSRTNVRLGLLVISAAVFLRLAVSLNRYSGAGKPPMFGDYEAQRHWMEITYNLPISEWYFDTPHNNLTYWGLDYPPLTAYHSWLSGAVADRLHPEWVELGTSQGHESHGHKLFMRYTALVADVLVFFSAVAVFVKVFWCVFLKQWIKLEKPFDDEEATFTEANIKTILVLILLLQPSSILIDHGHFQYNCISLGLALWGITAVISDHMIIGSVAFSLALNYKQMELYHALPFFFYLLGKSFSSQREDQSRVVSKPMESGRGEWPSSRDRKWSVLFTGLLCVAKLSIAVAASFVVLWLPFWVTGGTNGVLQVLRRLFPFSRGLYEDKVSNFWCSISIFIKVQKLFPRGLLVVVSSVMTLLATLPSSVYLLWRPRPYQFLVALVISSLSFFLFSFQVHEKTILLACLPVSLLTPFHPFLATTFQLVATFSMYPLFTQDGLCLAAWALCCLFSLVSILFLDITPFEMPLLDVPLKKLFLSLLTLLLALSTLSHIIPPPTSLPHLFPVLISGTSFVHFTLFYLYFNALMFGDVIQDFFSAENRQDRKSSQTKMTGDSMADFRLSRYPYPPPVGIRGAPEFINTCNVGGVSYSTDSSRTAVKTHTD